MLKCAKLGSLLCSFTSISFLTKKISVQIQEFYWKSTINTIKHKLSRGFQADMHNNIDSIEHNKIVMTS